MFTFSFLSDKISKMGVAPMTKEELLKKYGKRYKKGTILFKEGSEGRELYIIHKGKVSVFREIKGVKKVLAVLGKGDFFGEMAVLNKKPRSASIEVIEDSILIELNEDQLKEFLKESPEWAIKMLSVMAKRIENANQTIENLLLKDERLQVINALLQFIKDSKEKEWVPFDPHAFLTRVGVPEDFVKSVFAGLKRMGLIEVKGKHLKVKDSKRLEDLVNFMLWSEVRT